MSKKITAVACECSCEQSVNNEKVSAEAHEKICLSFSDHLIPCLSRRLMMYKYLLSRLPSDWFEKHGEEIESLALDYYVIELIAEAFRSDIEIEQPFDTADVCIAVSRKHGLAPLTWEGPVHEEATEKAAIKILSREYGDIIGPLSEPKSEHLGMIL